MQAWFPNDKLSRVSEKMSKVALPSLRLAAHPTEETRLELGATKFGGTPDLPSGMSWPEYEGSPLPFIAQINLSEVAAFDLSHLLPDSGILSFFFDLDAFFENLQMDSDARIWHVHYISAPLPELRRLTLPESIAHRRRYRPCNVTCTTEFTLPDYSLYDSSSIERLGLTEPLTDEEERAYYRVKAQLAGKDGAKYHVPIHRLLGHADVVQWNMHNQLEGRTDDWQMLFQVDSDDASNMDWGDTGRIYYWIRITDLAERNFNRLKVILQST